MRAQESERIYSGELKRELSPSGPIKDGSIYKVTMFQLLAFNRNPLSNSTAHLLFSEKMTYSLPGSVHTHAHKHTRAHIPTLFQEYCSITSWFWSHLLCLMGLLGETDRENEEMENYLSNQIVVFLWSDDEVALLFLCFLTTLLSNPWSRTVVHLG